jgi:hypothetical protein
VRSPRNRFRAEFRERRIETELLADPARTNADIAAALGVRSRSVRQERKRLEDLGVLAPRPATEEAA